MSKPGRTPILIVDDDPTVAEVTRRHISAHLPDLEVLVCSNPDLAMELVSTTDFSVVLCDLVMPGRSGVEILAEVHRRNPATVGILVTGQATKDAVIEAVNYGGVWKIVEKPWKVEGLIGWVREALELFSRRTSSPPKAAEAHSPAAKKPLVIRIKPAPKPSTTETPPAMNGRIQRTFAPRLPLPTVAARYGDLRLLDPGGVGAVYHARDTMLNIPVILKVLAPRFASDPQLVQSLILEAREVVRLSHSNIVAIHLLDRVGGTVYFVMDFVEGRTLRRILSKLGKLPPMTVAAIATSLASALKHALEHHLCHLRLRPDALMVDTHNRLRVLGFGFSSLARLAFRQDAPHHWVHVSPELAEGAMGDPRMDVYSMAVLLHELLTGSPPDHAGSSEPKSPTEYRPVSSEELPGSVREVLNRGFARSPQDRYATASELAHHFQLAVRQAEWPSETPPSHGDV